jgi:hypothetical protein
MSRDNMEHVEIVCGWRKVADAATLTIPGAKLVAAKGELPIMFLAGKPHGNPSLLRAYAEHRAKRRAEKEQRKAELDSQRAALAGAIEA